MPIYEYQCKKCSAHMEAMQKVSDKPLVKCRKCGGRLEKLLSAPAIQFKGSGWYVTDYAGKNSGAGEEKKGAEEKKSTDASTADTKSASKETKKTEAARAKKSPASTSGD